MVCGAAEEAYRGLPFPGRARPYRPGAARRAPGRGNRPDGGFRLSAVRAPYLRLSGVRAWILRLSAAPCGFLLPVLRRDGFRLLLP